MAASGTRVLIASRLFTPEVGAAAFRLQALADALASAGASVRVVTTVPPKGVVVPGSAHSFIVSRFPVLRDAGGNVRGYVQYLSFDIPLFFRLLFARADVVVAEPPPTTGLVVAVTSWLRRRPYVYYAADIWTEALAATSVPGMVTSLMRRVEGHVLRRAARVLAISDGVAEKVIAFGVDPARVATVGNGIDTNVFTVDGPFVHDRRPEVVDASSSERHTAQSPYFVYTGTMSEWQGAEVFIHAMPQVLAEYPDARLYFFGQGSAEPELRSLAAGSVPESVEFGGVIPPDKAAAWLRGATAALVSIVPGQGYDFAKPTKIYAAAACGAPVIFAGAGAALKLVSENTLGYSAAYTVDAVADAMRTALAEHPTASSQAARYARSAWVAGNASLAAAGGRSAAVVVGMSAGH